MNAPARIPLHQEMDIASRVAAALIAADISPEDPDYAELMASETNIQDRLIRILRAARHTEAQSKALGEIVSEMRERKARLDKKAERLRGVVLQAMGELGLTKLDAPDFSAAVTGASFKVIVTDKTAIPDNLCRITREPDKAQIKAAIIRHGDVPGAELANGEPSLTIRTR